MGYLEIKGLNWLLFTVILSCLAPKSWALAPPSQQELFGLKGNLQDFVFEDPLTRKGKKRHYRLYRTHEGPPPSQSNSRDSLSEPCWPSLYFYHGAAGTHQSYPFLLRLVDSLFQAGAIGPLQVIQLESNAGQATPSFYTDSQVFGPHYQLISSYFPQLVESQHQACPHERYVMGHSMGAFAAAKVMLDTLQNYKGYALHSGPLDLIDIQKMRIEVLKEHIRHNRYDFDPTSGRISFLYYAMSGAFSPNKSALYQVDLPFDMRGTLIRETLKSWEKHSPLILLQRIHLNHLDSSQIWIDAGSHDQLGISQGVKNFHHKMETLGITHHYEPYEGGHGDQLPQQFKKSLLFLLHQGP